MLRKLSSKSKTSSPQATRKTSDIASKLRDPGTEQHRSYVLYGRSGTGKTTLLGTFPKPLLLIDANDKGDDSLKGVDGVKVLDVKSWDEFEDAYWFAKEQSEAGNFSSVGVDTWTQLQQMLVASMEKKGADGKRGMSQRAWGDVSSMMKRYITMFRDLPAQTIFVAQDRTFTSDEENEDNALDPEVGPALSPSISKHLNASAYLIGNTFIEREVTKGPPKNGKRERIEKIIFSLRVGPNPIYITKVRKAKNIIAPSVIRNPTYKRIQAILNGSNTNEGKE